MIHKRPCIDDSQEVACKHPRQWEDTSHFASIVNGVHPNNAFQNHQISSEGKWEDIYAKHQDEGRFAEGEWNSCGTNKEYESSASGCVPYFWWMDSSAMDADIESEVAVHLPLFPEYFASCHQNPAFLRSNEVCSSLLSPRELVSVGPEYQADIPEWSQQYMKCSLDCLDTSDPQVSLRSSCAGLMADDDYGKQMMGTCVIPMPDSESTSKFHFENVGHRTDCECMDRGSIRCIGRHVTEAREKLRENLGPEIFRELGFCDMGEEVAKRWTEEEGLAFNNVVLSNPFSLGNVLSRTELSLYMLIVMMMSGRQLCVIPAGDDDSVMESLIVHEAAVHYENNNEEDCNEDIEDDDNNEGGVDSHENVVDDICRAVANEEDEGDIDEMSGPHVESFIDNYGCSDFHLVKGNNDCDYDDTQDDSCTSYDYQRDQVDSHGLPETLMDANQPSQ